MKGESPSCPGEEWGRQDSWTHTHLAFPGPRVLVLSPGHTIVTVGHLVGSHILNVAKVSGTLGDDASHLLLGAQVNLQGEKKNQITRSKEK